MAKPTNTPVLVFAKAVGAVPECSTARHAVSSRSRCCGSSILTSRVDMPKNGASNPVTSSTKPARRVATFPGVSGSGSKNSSTSHRSAGTSEIASRPSRSTSQNSSASAAPGKRAAYPTIAKLDAGCWPSDAMRCPLDLGTAEDSVAACGPDAQQDCCHGQVMQVPLRRRCRITRPYPTVWRQPPTRAGWFYVNRLLHIDTTEAVRVPVHAADTGRQSQAGGISWVSPPAAAVGPEPFNRGGRSIAHRPNNGRLA